VPSRFSWTLTDEWKRIHTEELYDLYFSPNITLLFKKNVMGSSCGRYGWQKVYIQDFVLRPREDNPLGRPRRRWEDNIKMNLKEMGRGGMDWIHQAQDRDR
jgi:hypothetical protein